MSEHTQLGNKDDVLSLATTNDPKLWKALTDFMELLEGLVDMCQFKNKVAAIEKGTMGLLEATEKLLHKCLAMLAALK